MRRRWRRRSSRRATARGSSSPCRARPRTGRSRPRRAPPGRDRSDRSCRARPSRRCPAGVPRSRSPARSARSAASPSPSSALSRSPRPLSTLQRSPQLALVCARKHRSATDPVRDELGGRRATVRPRRTRADEEHVAGDRRARVDARGETCLPQHLPGRRREAADRAVERGREDDVVGDGRAAEVRRAGRDGSSGSARRGVEGVENPRPLARRPLEDACRGDPVALRMQRSSTGTNTVSDANAMGLSTPPNSPGHTRVFRRGSGPTSFRCRPTGWLQTRSWVSRSQAITRPALPAPKTIGRRSGPMDARIGETWKS